MLIVVSMLVLVKKILKLCVMDVFCGIFLNPIIASRSFRAELVCECCSSIINNLWACEDLLEPT